VKEKEKDENGLQANHSCGPKANPTRVNNDFFLIMFKVVIRFL
jgi:hypothetical protein